MAGVGNPNMRKGAPSTNPGGRPRKTEDQRAAETYLLERTFSAAKRLVELEASDDEKIALSAVLGHLKMTIGDFQRIAGKDGESIAAPHSQLTHEELKALARAQLSKEKSTQGER